MLRRFTQLMPLWVVVLGIVGYLYPPPLVWFKPYLEFRFPRYGTVRTDGVELELRFAIEPWHVLGEEVTGQGTARGGGRSARRTARRTRPRRGEGGRVGPRSGARPMQKCA